MRTHNFIQRMVTNIFSRAILSVIAEIFSLAKTDILAKFFKNLFLWLYEQIRLSFPGLKDFYPLFKFEPILFPAKREAVKRSLRFRKREMKFQA